MSEPSRDDLRTWLHEVLAKTGDTPSGLARKAGLATTTLTRFLNDPEAHMLGMRSISKIAHVAGVRPFGMPPQAGPPGFGERATDPYDAAEADPYAPDADKDPLARAVAAILSGRNATDPWLLKTRALEAAGYMPGDILIVDLNRQPRAKDVVCAQDYRWSEGKAETIFRIYEPPYLVAATNDPILAEKVRRPLVVDNDHVIIKGVVIAALRAFATTK